MESSKIELTFSDERQPVVWVVNKSTHDFTPARQFGEIRFLSEGLMRKRNVAFMMRHFEAALAASEPNDWLLPTAMTVMCITASLAFYKRHNRVNLLLFEGGKYIGRVITFE